MQKDDKRQARRRIRVDTAPVLDAPVAALRSLASGQASKPMERPLLVLLVSHDDQHAALVLSELQRSGFEVQHQRVSEAGAFEATLGARAWDIVIARFPMAGWNGDQVLQRAQLLGSLVPVVLVCESIGEDAAATAIKQGASDCISIGQLQHRLAASVYQELVHRLKPVATARTAVALGEPANDAGIQAMDALPVALYRCDADGTILHYNQAAAMLWGREPTIGEDSWHGSWKVFTHDGRAMDPADCPIAVTLRTGRPVLGTEIIVERPDGSRRHVAPSPQPMFDADGRVVGAVEMLVDLTEQRHYKQRLLVSDAISRTMFDSSPVALLLLLPFSRITSANDKMVELSGYPRAELLGRTIDELRLRVDDALGQQLRARLGKEDIVDGLEMNLRRKDGSLRRILLSSQPIDVDGVRQRLHSLVDVTAQRAAMDESRLVQQAMASISQGVLISGPDRLTLSVNAAFEAMTGYSAQEMVGKPCSLLQGADTDPHVVLAIRAALDAGNYFAGEILNYRKDGSPFWNELSISPVRNDDGELTHFVGIQRNVSERRRQDSQIRLAAQIFAQSREGVAVMDADNKAVMVNQAFTEISGFSAADVLGKDPTELNSVASDDEGYRTRWDAIRATGRWQGEIVARRKDGTSYPETLTISVIRDDSGEICNYVRSFSDLSAQRAASERIRRLSHFDALTDLPNRNLLADRCEHDIKAARRDATPMTMLMLGIDQFKLVNDTLGPAGGDELLRLFAAHLSTSVREMDTVARVGGDEFVLVMPGESADGAHLLAERLLQSLSQPFDVKGTPVTVSASVGIAVFPPDGQDFQSLFKSAQVAMHQAKERGRATICFYSADMFQQTAELAALGAELRNAVALGQLYLHYQPFADLRSGRIGGMEALLRWSHPKLGMVSPARFIPVAERLGLIVDIGAWVLRQACADVRQWRRAGLGVPPVSVNLSPVQFRDPDLAHQVAAMLAEFEMDPAALCLELTEGAVMDDVTHSETLMRELKSLGVGLALDDFGTGYSSLSYLKLFPFDKVKIDQSFVRGIHTNASDAVIAKVVISMAHGLGLRAIAEGVETEQQCDFMRSNMCDEIQGYFFSRPVPADAMAALLLEERSLPAHLVRVQQTRTRTVLLVDDEPNITSALTRLLRSEGYRILTARSGPEGLTVLAGNAVDIIVADQRMPGMTGVEFLRQAKLSHPQTIRIVLSGHTELQSVTDAINEGAVYRFLTKPWDDAQLCGFIRDAFRHKDLADENEDLNIKIRTANQELAASNRQLQEVLDHKQHELSRGARSLSVMQEALHNIPLPILAIDDGVIAFANQGALEMLGQGRPLLLSRMDDVLPSLGAALAGAREGQLVDIAIDGRPCRCRWHTLGSASASEGRLVVFDPAGGAPGALAAPRDGAS